MTPSLVSRASRSARSTSARCRSRRGAPSWSSRWRTRARRRSRTAPRSGCAGTRSCSTPRPRRRPVPRHRRRAPPPRRPRLPRRRRPRAPRRPRHPRRSIRPTSTSSSPSSWARSSTLARAQANGRGLNVGVTYPTAPGLYRLVATLHDPSGVAYDAPTQAKLDAPSSSTSAACYTRGVRRTAVVALNTGASSTVGVRVLNAGSQVLGRAVVDAARRARLAADLAAHAADGRAASSGRGCRRRACRSRHRSPRRSTPTVAAPGRQRRRRAVRDGTRPRRANTCCCSTWSRRTTARCPRCGSTPSIVRVR